MQSACVILDYRLWPVYVLTHLYTLSHKRHDFKEVVTEHTCFDVLYNFLCNTARSTTNSREVRWCSCKVPFIFVLF